MINYPSFFSILFFQSFQPLADGGGVAGVAEVLTGLLQGGAGGVEARFHSAAGGEEFVEFVLYFDADFAVACLREDASCGLYAVVDLDQRFLELCNYFGGLSCLFFSVLDGLHEFQREFFAAEACDFFRSERGHLIQ